MIITSRKTHSKKTTNKTSNNMQDSSEKEIIQDTLKRKLSLSVLKHLHEKEELSDDAFRQVIAQSISEEMACTTMTLQEKRELAQSVFNSMRRLDVLQPLMDDPLVTEIMVNGHKRIFYEKNGRLFESNIHFKDQSTLESIITVFFSRANRPLNECSPIADLRLPDGSRANAVLPPVAPDGPIFTIRKFTGIRPDIETLIRQDFISESAASFIKSAVLNKKTIFICGGTGSGKTTFLNTLSSFIPIDERVVTIEDSAELSLQGIKNLVRLEARLPGPDGNGAIPIGLLIRTALRMRPDRIIVGEVRGSEAADMLHALNTGHPGSLCTGHANSCIDMLNRLSTMVLAGSSLPFEAVTRQISMGIDVLIFIQRDSQGQRKVHEIVQMGKTENGDFSVIPKYIRKEDNGLERIL